MITGGTVLLRKTDGTEVEAVLDAGKWSTKDEHLARLLSRREIEPGVVADPVAVELHEVARIFGGNVAKMVEQPDPPGVVY